MQNLPAELTKSKLKHLSNEIKSAEEHLEAMEDKIALQEAYLKGLCAAQAIITADYSDMQTSEL